jgi:hypothetical protein
VKKRKEIPKKDREKQADEGEGRTARCKGRKRGEKGKEQAPFP